MAQLPDACGGYGALCARRYRFKPAPWADLFATLLTFLGDNRAALMMRISRSWDEDDDAGSGCGSADANAVRSGASECRSALLALQTKLPDLPQCKK